METRVAVRPSSDKHLAPTTQFYFCSLPLRLDTYASCGYGCSYCFAANRGGVSRPMGGTFDNSKLKRRLKRLSLGNEAKSVVDEYVARRQPIHLGGMSDPFTPQEMSERATLRALTTLAEYSYPTVISSKGIEFASTPYVEILAEGNFLVQVSFSTLDDGLARDIERGTPSPSERLKALTQASEMGVRTAVRHQPVLPGREHEMVRIIRAAAQAGARHYAAEFLKLGIENARRQRTMANHLHDLEGRFGSERIRDGREWILPVEYRLPWVLDARSACHAGRPLLRSRRYRPPPPRRWECLLQCGRFAPPRCRKSEQPHIPYRRTAPPQRRSLVRLNCQRMGTDAEYRTVHEQPDENA